MRRKYILESRKLCTLSKKMRVAAITFAECLEAYRVAPMDKANPALVSQAEYFALKKMLRFAKTQQEYFIVYVEAKGCFPQIAAAAEAKLTDEECRPDP